MGKLTFLGLAERFLKEENKPLSPGEIWKIAQQKGYDQQLESKSQAPVNTLYSAIFTNTENRRDTLFAKVGESPARYFLKSLLDANPNLATANTAGDDTPSTPIEYTEADLHPFLAYYARIYFKAYSKTIRHNTSKKKEFGEWVHPDMIGVYYVFDDWKRSVRDLSAATGNATVKLYSFEIKKSLSFANLREAFFQAVSNSSWAQEGYLVAVQISADEDFRSELRRLSASFGIGVIRIVLDDPDSSEILFPARQRDGIDWDTLNKLTMNKDVEDLLVRIKNDLQTTDVILEKYDPILTTDDLVKTLTKKKVK